MSEAEAAAPVRNIGPLTVFLLVLAGLIYSLLFPINRIATENGVPALGYVVWLSLGGGALMLIACLVTRKMPRLGRRHAEPGAGMGRGLDAKGEPGTEMLNAYLAKLAEAGYVPVRDWAAVSN